MKIARTAVVVAIICLLASGIFAKPQSEASSGPSPADASVFDYQKYINANKILTFATNVGSVFNDFSQILFRPNGFYYPYTSITDILNGVNTKTVVYAAGLWLAGKAGGNLKVSVAEYRSEYTPGPMVAGTFVPDAETDPKYRVYHLFAESLASNPNLDYLQWPVDQGAPITPSGKPLLKGTQTLWTLFNDADSSHHFLPDVPSYPLGVEVHQLLWATSDPGEEQVVHLQYKMYNRSVSPIDSFYISFWADPDLGYVRDDLVGCDTSRNIFFAYNSQNFDSTYGARPPAWGGKVVAGPLVSDTGGMGTFWGNPIPDKRNIGMTSFQKYVNGTDPTSKAQVLNYMKGLGRLGEPLPNGTRYAVPGDPEAGTGDLDSAASDRRLMVTFGPLTFLPGDSQQLVLKFAVGQGANRLESIHLLKEILEGHPITCCVGTTGNVDGSPDGIIDISDLFALIGYLIGHDPAPGCAYEADVNNSGVINIVDVVMLVDHLVYDIPLPACP